MVEEGKFDLQKINYDSLMYALNFGSAIRQITKLYPSGGKESKVYPPTFSEGKYAYESRIKDDGSVVQTVLLDSVQSQANRMEEALLQTIRSGRINVKLLYTDFSDNFPGIGKVSTYETPHRIADAIFRESSLDGIPFRDTEIGKSFVNSSTRNATGLFQYCPHALIFGVWDSTAPGVMGNKFQRAIVSEIVGFNAISGVHTLSRIDPIIHSNPSLFEAPDGTWTPIPEKAAKEGNKLKKFSKKLSELNLGNVSPTIKETGGGVSIDEAVQTTVISIPALRRLRFPVDGKSNEELDNKARAVLLALALSAISHTRDLGFDLRSRCLLVSKGDSPLEMLRKDSGPMYFSLDSRSADEILAQSIKEAKQSGLPWMDNDISLKPNQNLIDLIRRSRELHDERDTKDSSQ